jgi:histidine triad (HIT) family protein
MTNIFLKIINGEIPAEFIYQDDDVIVIKDIAPQAPVHLLIIPKKTVVDISEVDERLAGRIVMVANEMARKFGIAEAGFRLVVNTGKDGGQTVPQLHMHLLGGRDMGWPPG